VTSEACVQGEGDQIRWKVDQFSVRSTHCDRQLASDGDVERLLTASSRRPDLGAVELPAQKSRQRLSVQAKVITISRRVRKFAYSTQQQ
jgi:hypothetical protein